MLTIKLFEYETRNTFWNYILNYVSNFFLWIFGWYENI